MISVRRGFFSPIFYLSSILRNQSMLYKSLTEEIAAQLPRKDVYLVEICMQTNEQIIITTDTTLPQKLIETKDILGIRVNMAIDFIELYPKI